jgi:hypothetical protein
MYGGVLGDALLDASNAYLKAVVDAPRERVEQQKRELELERLKSQAALDRARAAFEDRRVSGATGRPQYVKTKQGVIERNPDTGEWSMAYEAPPEAPKDQKAKEVFDNELIRLIEQKLGPRGTWTYEGLQRTDIRDLYDMLRRGSDIQMLPGGGGGATTNRNVREGSGTPAPPTPTPEPSSSPVAPAPQPAPRPAGAGTPTSPEPVVPESRAQLRTNPALVTHYTTRYKAIPKEQAHKEMQATLDAEGLTPAQKDEKVASMAQAYITAYKTQPPGFAPGATPPETSLTRTAAPGASAPTTGPGGTRVPVVRPGLSPEQEAEETRKTQDAALKAEENERQRREAQIKEEQERRATDAVARQRALDLTGKFSNDQAAMANDLFAQGKVRPETEGYYPLLNAAEKKMVNDILLAPELVEEERKKAKELREARTEERAALKLAQPSLDELKALKMTQDLSEMILPLLERGNIGMGGKGKQIYNTVMQYSPLWKNQKIQEVEAQLKKEGVTGKIDAAMVLPRLLAQQSEDPKVQLSSSANYLAGQARLQTLSSILVYVHAMAVKRSGGGTTRGVIKADLDNAERLFNPTLFLTNPAQLMENLKALQDFIQSARPEIEETVRSYGIDPRSRQFIGTATSPMPGRTPGAPTAPEDVDRVNRGPKKKVAQE